MGLNELSEVLWRERRLLELLLFKLDEERLLLAHGRTRWLGHATREVESVLERLRGLELGRAVEAEDVAVELEVEPGAGLLEIAGRAPAPWEDLLRDHHRELVDLTAQVRDLTEVIRELLATSHRDLEETLTTLEQSVTAERTPSPR